MITAARSEVTTRRRFVLRDVLIAQPRPHVISLMLVKVLLSSFTWCRLWQRPSRHILLGTRVGRVFRGVTAGSDRGRRGSFILNARAAASVAEGVLGVPPKLRLVLGVVLRSWVLLQVVWLHLHKWGNARDTRQRGQLQKTDIIKIRRRLRFKSELVAPRTTSPEKTDFLRIV